MLVLCVRALVLLFSFLVACSLVFPCCVFVCNVFVLCFHVVLQRSFDLSSARVIHSCCVFVSCFGLAF